ncbi:MAG TPA: GyrI-like domain-containing protein [Chitinophagaceae bacterium]|nr:GyrI-like domain-containing protein [Chitinophagaceae bacterium]
MATASRAKKITLALIIILILATLSTYILIPSSLPVSKIIYVHATPGGTSRTLSNENKWKEWWPTPNTQSPYAYNNFTFDPDRAVIDIMGVIIRNSGDSIYSTIAILPLSIDSAAIQWKCSIQTGNNPITRVRQYFKAKQVKENMNDLFAQLKPYLEKKENIYGFPIQRTRVTDTVLITTTITTNTQPQPADIYTLIQKLRNYASGQDAKEMNYPMLNIYRADSNRFETMVALAINKSIPETNDIKLRRMVPGNILIAEVKGGRHTIEETFRQLEHYLHDFRLIPPAKPFESLVTDRLKETDTAKWVTRVYYPVL